MPRCPWPKSELDILYHDTEWGVPQREDRVLFEFLILEGAQAGLSWSTILNKRENYREAFDRFDPERIARYNSRKIASLLTNPGIVRNRLKLNAAVTNAQAFLALRSSGVTLAQHLWSFIDATGKMQPRINRWTIPAHVPALTPESDAMSKSLKRLGFTFVGSTICYALMQATGMVDDHLASCSRHGAASAPH